MSRMFQNVLTDLCVHFVHLNKPEIAYETYKILIEPEVGFLTESDTYASFLLDKMIKIKTVRNLILLHIFQ